MKELITTKNLILRFPEIDDFSVLKSFEKQNRDHLEKWETMTELPTDEDYRNRLINWRKECEEGKSARFFIFDKKNLNQMIGMCNLTQIFRGVFQACYLGYKIDHEYEGKGFMFEALQQTIQLAFEELKLHRIMANYMPINMRSAKLLNRLGFAIEGFAKNYLLINNQWEDHILTALSYEKWLDRQLQPLKSSSLIFREANIGDLESIVTLLFQDQLGQSRENITHPLSESYLESFAKISSDPNSELMVLEHEGVVIGVMQITYLHHLTFQGGKVAHIEGVRIHKDHQSKGFGTQMFQWGFERIKNRGCHRVQLMTDKRRRSAKKFYKDIGFSDTHEGMKLFIE